MRGLQGMGGLKGMNGFHACANPACGRLTPFPVNGMCARCAGTTVETYIDSMKPRAAVTWLYACAACPANTVRPFWTQRPGVFLCGNCASHKPGDPDQTSAVNYEGPVYRTEPTERIPSCR